LGQTSIKTLSRFFATETTPEVEELDEIEILVG
jgi:hypothetical protein